MRKYAVELQPYGVSNFSVMGTRSGKLLKDRADDFTEILRTRIIVHHLHNLHGAVR
jgi:hypothetical protein